jgi:hypothetical protein
VRSCALFARSYVIITKCLKIRNKDREEKKMSSMNKIQNFVTKCYVNSNVLLNSNLLQDLLMLAKIIAYAIFSFFEILFRNILPATYLNKNIKGDVVCITGAGFIYNNNN